MAGLCWLMYGHTLHHENVLDDGLYVTENPYLKDARSFLYPFEFKEFARSHAVHGTSSDVTLNFITRPVTYATFFLNLQLDGKATPGFRLMNMGFHLLNALLLYHLCQRLTGHSRISLISALVFLCHPLATESVTYIAQRFELLVTLFALAALISWLKAGQADEMNEKAGMRWRVASLAFTLLGMLSKESGFLIPFLILGMDILLNRKSALKTLWSLRWHALLLPIVPGLILAFHFINDVEGTGIAGALHITNVSINPVTISDYAMTQVCAWLTYLRLILLPYGQSFDHDYPLVTSPLDPRFMMSAAIIVTLLTASFMFWRRSHRLGGLTLSGLVFFLVTLAPSSSIIPLPDVFAEHRSYLASAGIIISLAGILLCLQSWSSTLSKPLNYSLVAAIPILMLCTLTRNEVLRSRESIWQDAYAKGSERARVLKGLGIAAFNAGRPEEAIKLFQRSTQKHPKDFESWHNLCQLLIRKGRFQEALDQSRAAVQEVGPLLPLAHMHAYALRGLGHRQQAVEVWNEIARVIPDQREAHLNLAELMVEANQWARAAMHLNAAERSGPLSPEHAALKARITPQIAGNP